MYRVRRCRVFWRCSCDDNDRQDESTTFFCLFDYFHNDEENKNIVRFAFDADNKMTRAIRTSIERGSENSSANEAS